MWYSDMKKTEAEVRFDPPSAPTYPFCLITHLSTDKAREYEIFHASKANETKNKSFKKITTSEVKELIAEKQTD